MTEDAPLPPIGLLRIDHVGIAVPDLDAAIEFYERVFGMRCVHTEVNEEQGVREAMLAVGDGADRVQLLAPTSPDSAIARFLNRSGPGVQQVAYTVTDVDAASAALSARGVRLLYEEPRRGTAGSLTRSDAAPTQRRPSADAAPPRAPPRRGVERSASARERYATLLHQTREQAN
jgi:methylmalonyl-CoA/ethylmalonyl-CoA epimerase